MHLPFVFLVVLSVAGFFSPAHGIFEGTSVQDFMDNFVDEEQFRQDGVTSLNESTRDLIWSYFKAYHGRVYSSHKEEKQRRLIVHNNIHRILQHKLKRSRTFEIGLNNLADLTTDEYNRFKKGYISPANSKRRTDGLSKRDQHHHQRRGKNSDNKRSSSSLFETFLTTNKKRTSKLPSSFDWRKKNVVGSVKDQQQCGSCYAFATSAVMESIYAIKNKAQSVVDLSPQQIVDCAGYGCDGGNFPPSVDYLNQQGGEQATWKSYPYVGVQQSCTTDDLSYSQLGNIQYTGIAQGDEKSLAADLVSYGPIFVGVDASSQDFQLYTSGVLSTTDCGNQPENIDHAITAVGYGYDTTLQLSYWIIKNSWSATWGEDGYLRLAKDAGNMCGVATDAYYAELS